ncbi:MAG: DDE-type integrase/transposase/recombinase [Candidatus Aenigmatarchaeota archaeon]
MKCNKCGSENVIRYGIRKNRHEALQRYLCKQCSSRFIERNVMNNTRRKAELLTVSLDLYFKGLSLRKVKDHLHQFYNVKMSHTTILNWIYKFSMFASQNFGGMKIKSSEEWNADETVLYFKRNPYWMWNVLDKKTKFLVAFQLAKYRTIEECDVFKNARKATENIPKLITTDSFMGYPKMISESFPESSHKRIKGIQQKKYSNTIERFHSNVKERYKVMRGFGSENGANLILNGWKTYYNFVRPHMGIGNITPAQAAGINLNLGRNKWNGLIESAKRVS